MDGLNGWSPLATVLLLAGLVFCVALLAAHYLRAGTRWWVGRMMARQIRRAGVR